MRLRLIAEDERRLSAALRRAGSREIGGQIFAEQLAPSDFRVVKLTVQHGGGAFASFVVDVARAAREAARFFLRTGADYRRFNYLGEWHSHPSFAVEPSAVDDRSMWSLLEDLNYPSSFIVLMIVRLEGLTLRRGAWVYEHGPRRSPVALELEPATA